jgi:hypothetical protein
MQASRHEPISTHSRLHDRRRPMLLHHMKRQHHVKRQRLITTTTSDSSFKGQRSLLENACLEKPFPQKQAGGLFCSAG